MIALWRDMLLLSSLIACCALSLVLSIFHRYYFGSDMFFFCRLYRLQEEGARRVTMLMLQRYAIANTARMALPRMALPRYVA